MDPSAHSGIPGFRKVKPKRKQKTTPSRQRRDARRAIEQLLDERNEDWASGGRSDVAVSRSDWALAFQYVALRSGGGEQGAPFAGRSASCVSPPTPPTPRLAARCRSRR
jgi:hypothetical protein